MKLFVCIVSFVIGTLTTTAQVRIPPYPDSLFTTYYHQRVTQFALLPQTSGDIIFIGNSIVDGGEWSELFSDLAIKNRGISGDNSAGVLNRMAEVAKRKPAKVFLMIGVNDLARNVSRDSILKNILTTVTYLKEQTPLTKVFVQSLLPVNDVYQKFAGHTSKGNLIDGLNEKLQKQAAEYAYNFIDLHTTFSDENKKLQKDFTNDGLHLNGTGYLLWKHAIYPYVYDLQKSVSLLPEPQQLEWKKKLFPLYKCQSILVSNEVLMKEGLYLQKVLQKMGLILPINTKPTQKGSFTIELKINKVTSPVLEDEAYRLDVNEEKVVLTANTSHGIFNGLQTILQLARSGVFIDACTITDWPAFTWRGYMIDVGRNYMSMKLLKQQIDVMAKYRLNVFHFHATEDIAWRIAIKQYPQLTSPESMLRNKGQYYTQAEIKDLVNYCTERHITFVPEIDMPGHSAAFTRSMHTNMQSDSGMVIVKNILKELCNTLDIPYIHIGADEVKITNQSFIPTVTGYIESLGKRVIGWQPGGNFTGNTIRQLWMDDNGRSLAKSNIQYIDSKHLYLNHMDPLESVVTIFNRKIGSKDQGDSSTLGGTICVWHDRAVANDEDILRMNPVYPGMLAFAERSWRGGGKNNWIANISDGDVRGFTAFENRLLDHKKLYFNDKPFAYTRQSQIKWKLFGPYKNEGDVDKKFAPEKFFQTKSLQPYKEEVGGTIVLKHWWYPLIEGAIKNPTDSSTWYASTNIWSNAAGEKEFWIGFNNISRSPATHSPPANAWDNKGSAVWVNEKLIPPPQWIHAEQKGHAEIPLVDEGYEYRAPTKILLKKGWNTVLMKAPTGSFKGENWQNPVKWMFTFVPVEE